MQATAVVIERPEKLALRALQLEPAAAGDIVVEVEWSGISTGTERLLWSGRMPPFPGMGYPLVPGYESVGRVVEAGAETDLAPGERVFVPGAACFGEVRGLFGGAASHLVVPAARVRRVPEPLADQATLLALAATAHHAVVDGLPELVVGHGALGRLIARTSVALGGEPPVVWEQAADRRGGATGYEVLAPEEDARRDYRRICDVSGDPAVLDALIARLQPRGEVVLAGFYAAPVAFAFPPAFMREARLRVAAEWQDADLAAVQTLVAQGALSLDGLITHRSPAHAAEAAYRTAFTAPDCLKMILEWRASS